MTQLLIGSPPKNTPLASAQDASVDRDDRRQRRRVDQQRA